MSRCVSDLALERYLLDELVVTADREHIIGCVECRAELAAKRRAGDAYTTSREAKHLGQLLATTEQILVPPRRRHRLGFAVAVIAIIAVAAILLWPRRASDPEAEILAVEQSWTQAYVHNDVAALDAILADNYRATDPSGRTVTKADDLERTKTLHYDVFDTTDIQVRVWGDTAVATGHSEIRGTNAGLPFAAKIAFTDTLARIDGRWRAVAAHVTRAR